MSENSTPQTFRPKNNRKGQYANYTGHKLKPLKIAQRISELVSNFVIGTLNLHWHFPVLSLASTNTKNPTFTMFVPNGSSFVAGFWTTTKQDRKWVTAQWNVHVTLLKMSHRWSLVDTGYTYLHHKSMFTAAEPRWFEPKDEYLITVQAITPVPLKLDDCAFTCDTNLEICKNHTRRTMFLLSLCVFLSYVSNISIMVFMFY